MIVKIRCLVNGIDIYSHSDTVSIQSKSSMYINPAGNTPCKFGDNALDGSARTYKGISVKCEMFNSGCYVYYLVF